MTVLIMNDRPLRRPDRPLTIRGRSAHLLPSDHAAIKEQRTLYPNVITDAYSQDELLIPTREWAVV